MNTPKVLFPVLLTMALLQAVHAEESKNPPKGSEVSPEIEQRVEGLELEVLELRRLLEEGTTSGNLAPNTAEAITSRLDGLERAMAELRRDLAAANEDNQITADAVDELSQLEQRRAHLSVYGSIVVADFDNANSVIDGEAIELVISGRPHDRLGFFTEIEFERAAEVGGDRGGEVVIEQAWATFGLTRWLHFKAGIVLMPFGNYNLDHYAPIREVISRPLVSHVVVPSDWTDNGFGITGRQGLGGGWVFNYEALVVAGLDENISAQGMRAARQPFGVDNNNNKAMIGRIAFDHRGLFEGGFSYYDGKYDDASTLNLQGWAGHFFGKMGPFRLVGEYNRFTAEQASFPDMILEGYYVRGLFDLFQKSIRNKTFPYARLSLVAQYDDVELSQPTGAGLILNQERRWTLGLNYRPSANWVIKVNREKNESEGTPLLNGNSNAWLAAVGFIY